MLATSHHSLRGSRGFQVRVNGRNPFTPNRKWVTIPWTRWFSGAQHIAVQTDSRPNLAAIPARNRKFVYTISAVRRREARGSGTPIVHYEHAFNA